MKASNMAICLCFALACGSGANSQGLLKKLKDKATEIAGQGSTTTPANGGTAPNQPNTTNNTGRNTANRGGQGLVTTPPDVEENLGVAETSFKNGSYGEARYAIQQAMLGVEMQIGKNILKSLPAAIGTLKKDTTTDQVTSAGYGWSGLTIQREYNDGADKNLKVTIANNAVWMQAVNVYLSNPGMAQSTGGEQNWKQTRLKGHRAVIEYDESTGYKISVPMGQTSLLMIEGVNFATEQEFMTAAGQINVDSIKKSLGEK